MAGSLKKMFREGCLEALECQARRDAAWLHAKKALPISVLLLVCFPRVLPLTSVVILNLRAPNLCSAAQTPYHHL